MRVTKDQRNVAGAKAEAKRNLGPEPKVSTLYGLN